MKSTIPLGWSTYQMEKPSGYDEEYGWDFYYDYGWVFSGEESALNRFGYYSLAKLDYLREIENTFRQGIFIFDKLVFQVPFSEPDSELYNSKWTSYGSFLEKDVSCEWVFFAVDALRELERIFGDAIQNCEITLLPSFHIGWEEPEESDEWGGYVRGSDPNIVSAMLKPQDYARQRLHKCQHIQTNSMLVSQARDAKLSLDIPCIRGGNLKDLISLRRDEFEAFERWRKYVEEVTGSERVTKAAISQAVKQGIEELSDRLNILKRKGLFDAVGSILTSASSLAAFLFEGQIATVAGTLSGLAALTNTLKAVFEYTTEDSKIRKDKFYFAWLIEESSRKG